jgi:hypothetical protein
VDFRLLGDCSLWAVFFENYKRRCQNFWEAFFSGEKYLFANFGEKMVSATVLGDFFADSSGRAAGSAEIVPARSLGRMRSGYASAGAVDADGRL